MLGALRGRRGPWPEPGGRRSLNPESPEYSLIREQALNHLTDPCTGDGIHSVARAIATLISVPQQTRHDDTHQTLMNTLADII